MIDTPCRSWSATLLVVFALALAPTHAAGQATDDSCPYRACALRIEPRGLGPAIVRGAEGEVVGRVGVFGADRRLEALVSRSDSAAWYAERHRRTAPIGAVAAFAGSLLLTAPAFADQVGEVTVVAASVGGAALTVYGTVVLTRAQRALSRAIWWYNESLVPPER